MPLEQVEGIPCLFIKRQGSKIILYDKKGQRMPLGSLIESPAASRSYKGAFSYQDQDITQSDLEQDLIEYMEAQNG